MARMPRSWHEHHVHGLNVVFIDSCCIEGSHDLLSVHVVSVAVGAAMRLLVGLSVTVDNVLCTGKNEGNRAQMRTKE